MKLLYACLAIFAVAGLGYHIGKRVQARASKAQADAIHASIKRFEDAAAQLKATLSPGEIYDAMRQEAKRRGESLPTDTVARGPLPIKPEDIEPALASGGLAMMKDYSGKDN
jgi:hypothetical protein